MAVLCHFASLAEYAAFREFTVSGVLLVSKASLCHKVRFVRMLAVSGNVFALATEFPTASATA